MLTKPEYVKSGRIKSAKVEPEYYTKKGNSVMLFIVGLGLLGFIVMYAKILYH